MLNGFRERWALGRIIRCMLVESRASQIARTLLICLFLPVSILSTYLYKLLVDHILVNGNIEVLPLICAGMMLTFIVRQIMEFLQLYLEHNAKERSSKKLHAAVFDGFYISENLNPDDERIGHKMNVLDKDISIVVEIVMKYAPAHYVNILGMFVYGIIVCYMEWKLALLCTLVLVLFYKANAVLEKNIQKVSSDHKRANERYENWLVHVFSSWKEILSLQAEDEVIDVFEKKTREIDSTYRRSGKLHSFYDFIQSAHYRIFWQLLIYAIGGVCIIRGSLTVGTLLVFIAYFNKMINSYRKVAQMNLMIQENKASILDVYNMKTCGENMEISVHAPPGEGKIELHNISFRYADNSDDVFRDTSFCVEPGEWIAIRSKSGEGKTTLRRLICGDLCPQKGTITIDGTDVNDRSIPNRRSVMVITHDEWLFNLSIKENLKVANERISDAELEEVCRKFGMHEYIMTLPQKYDTVVGEKGSHFSHGQRQRISLARAYLKVRDYSVVIFDETISAIDREGKASFYEHFLPLIKGKTVIYISHEMDRLDLFDKVYTIRGKQIVRE